MNDPGPVAFARDVLGVDLWAEQQRLVEKLSSPDFRLATPLEQYIAQKAEARRMWEKLVRLLYPGAIVTYGQAGREASRRADRLITPSRRLPMAYHTKKNPRRRAGRAKTD